MIAAPPGAPPLRILLVEDHEMLRGILQKSLTAAGFEVTVVSTGEQAIECFECGARPQLLMSDIRIPGRMNGLDLARWAQQRDPSLAILLQTGFSSIDTGDFQVLRKPFDAEMLMGAIREALARRIDGTVAQPAD